MACVRWINGTLKKQTSVTTISPSHGGSMHDAAYTLDKPTTVTMGERSLASLLPLGG